RAPPRGAWVHHVVMEEGGGWQELHYAAQPHRPRPLIARQPPRHQEEDGPQPFAPRPRDELAHLPDEIHRRVDLPPDLRLYGGQLAADHDGDPLLEKGFESGRRGEPRAGVGRGQRSSTRSRILISGVSAAPWISTTENFSRTSVTFPVASSSSSSPRSSPVRGCTMGILSRRRLTMLPGLTPSCAVR